MCINFRPSQKKFIRERFDLDIDFDYPAEAWKGYTAPIVLSRQGALTAKPAHFGLIPSWCKSAADAKKLSSGTMNARVETVATKPSFRHSWMKSYRCLVPMQEFYEPCYESGKAQRFRVGRADGQDFCVGGIWAWWVDPETKAGTVSVSLLTLNADEHPVLNRLHKPGDEKRSLFVVPEDEYGLWLEAAPEEARLMLQLLPEDAYSLSM